MDEKVGFGPGYGGRATLAGPNGAGGVLSRQSFTIVYNGRTVGQWVALGARPGPHGTNFSFLGGRICCSWASAFPLNAKFGAPATSRLFRGANIASSVFASRTGPGTAHFTEFSTTDRYLLFKFTGGNLPAPLYGWAELSVSLPGNLGGPNVTLIDYAYDISGAQLPAGDTGTPEPSTFALAGLAALALGARGLRIWRAARKAAYVAGLRAADHTGGAASMAKT